LQDGRLAVRSATTPVLYRVDPNQVFIRATAPGVYRLRNNAYVDCETERPTPPAVNGLPTHPSALDYWRQPH
jgi:hypothetical protein